MEFEDVVRGRMGMYSFFSSVFIDVPPKELLKDLYEENVKFPKLKGVDTIINYPKKFKSFEDFERAVRQEYTAVFIGPFSNYVSLYQSEYEGENPYGKVTLRVKEMFRRFGYECIHREPADHLGVYMAFMVESCKELLNGKIDELKKQREVMRELEKWIFDFCNNVENHRDAMFYKGIVKMLRDFIKIDKNLIEELILYATRNK